MLEHQSPLWVAVVDFKKAFDCVNHASLWGALQEQGVSPLYIQLLQRLYLNQNGEVQCDRVSKKFAINRGSKQGDPISPALFNAVLEKAMRRLKLKWQRLGYGIKITGCDDAALLNLRFADDVLLTGTSLEEVRSMLADMCTEMTRVGLEVHWGKTKIMSNGMDTESDLRQTLVKGVTVEVLDPAASTLYLGRSLCLTEVHNTEIVHRIARAWAKFSVFRPELTDKNYSLFSRLRLFHSVVTPTVLYGCGSWAMTREREHMLQTAQRKMLRIILGRGRRPLSLSESSEDYEELVDVIVATEDEEELLEPWHEWLQRVTREALLAMGRVGVPDWAEEQARRKWRWAGHICRRTDGRWSRKVLDLMPVGQRRRQRPRCRWSDAIHRFMNRAAPGDGHSVEFWCAMAADRDSWANLEEDFANNSGA